MMNRKVEASRRASIPKAVKAMQLGADLVVFPEGVWNKSPNKLILDLWPGIYRIACEIGAKVVPIVHYIRDCRKSCVKLSKRYYGRMVLFDDGDLR